MSILTSSILSQTRLLPLPHPLSVATTPRKHKHDASARLFEDAKRAEQAEKREIERREKTMNALLTRQAEQNWDGEEPIADAVLRMLVDKYKPLRSGTIITADEKLTKSAPSIRVQCIPPNPSLSSSGSALEAPITSNRPLTYPEIDRSKQLKDQPLLPAVEGHRPWLTNFTAPSHATASIRLGNFKPARSEDSPVHDEKARKLEKADRRRFQTALKLEGAKESVLEHRLGVKQQKRPHANPITMKGWKTLVEERIEVCSACVSYSLAASHYFMKNARAQGSFDNIKGRGKPVAISNDEKNPFIGREEFLLNRIVQRNGAVPPWVELQTGKIRFILAFDCQ
jgi:DnaJ homolog subfamily C member 28